MLIHAQQAVDNTAFLAGGKEIRVERALRAAGGGIEGSAQALDLFAAPARWEGFGLTPLEAMACGVPAVAARVGAFAATGNGAQPSYPTTESVLPEVTDA